MQPDQTTSQPTQSSSDEIDLLQLIQSVTRTWKVWFIALFLVTLALITFHAVRILIAVPEQTFSTPIRLSFPGVKQDRFPSGAKFSIGDIVAPSVVKLAYEKNKLEDYGFSIADIQGALSATPYSPTYPLIMARYKKRMEDKKLSPDQINDLQKQMEDELNQATSGEILISLRTDKQNLPKNIAAQFLSDIPSIWAEKAIKEKGVLNINARIASSKSLNLELIQREEPLVAADLLNEKLNLLKRNIAAISEFEGVESVKDVESGMKLADLSFAIHDLDQYVLSNLIAPIRLLGLSSSPSASSFYYRNKIYQLTNEITQLNKEANAIKQVYDSYLRADSMAGAKGDASSNSGLSPQLSGDLIEKLVSLSGDGAREKYKQQLNDDWLNISRNIATKEGELADCNFILASLEKSASSKAVQAEQQEYLTKFKTQLPAALEQISRYFDITERIYSQLSAESIGVSDQLYVPVTNSIMVEKNLIDIKATLLTWIALMFLTSVLVVPTCMIRNAIKDKKAAQ